jgi:hypothetical protein
MVYGLRLLRLKPVNSYWSNLRTAGFNGDRRPVLLGLVREI